MAITYTCQRDNCPIWTKKYYRQVLQQFQFLPWRPYCFEEQLESKNINKRPHHHNWDVAYHRRPDQHDPKGHDGKHKPCQAAVAPRFNKENTISVDEIILDAACEARGYVRDSMRD